MNISQIIIYIFQYSTRKKINNSLKKLIYIGEEIKINFIDVGAAGEVNERWRYLSKNINYFGFEPDERSRLLLKNDYNFKFLTNSFLISLESLKRKNDNLRRMNFLFNKFMVLFFPNFKSHSLY